MNGSVSEGKLLSEQFGVAGPPAARPLAVIEAELYVLERMNRIAVAPLAWFAA